MAVTLRDGAETRDPRLDRLVQFDAKSLAYPIRTLITPAQAVKPRSYTWNVGANLDQGAEGACVGFSWTHELVARPGRVHGIDGRFARERVYWEAQRRDPWPGGAYPGASPFYEGTSVLAAAQVLHELGYFKEYRWAGVGPSPVLEDLVLAVGYKGPAVLGIPWYQGMFDTDERGFIEPSGYVAGGHAILCHSVNVREEYFRLHNSWGPTWGDRSEPQHAGTCKISFRALDRLLHEDGEAAIPIGRAVPRAA